jgi:outer membrane lipoprotein-sorting protein
MRFIILFLVSFALPGTILLAQNKQYATAQDSDPEAISLLSKIRTKYDAFKTMEADFSLDILIPGNAVETQEGKIRRAGNSVRFKLGGQEGIINEKAAYVIQHANKEVMINNLPEPGELNGMLTPQTLFSFYEGDEFVLALQGEETYEGRSLQVIELKPVNREESEFTKLRMLVDKTNKELVSIKAFSRDGSNFTFYLGKTKGDVAFAANTFVFDKKEFPGYHVEDLRY